MNCTKSASNCLRNLVVHWRGSSLACKRNSRCQVAQYGKQDEQSVQPELRSVLAMTWMRHSRNQVNAVLGHSIRLCHSTLVLPRKSGWLHSGRHRLRHVPCPERQFGWTGAFHCDVYISSALPWRSFHGNSPWRSAGCGCCAHFAARAALREGVGAMEYLWCVRHAALCPRQRPLGLKIVREEIVTMTWPNQQGFGFATFGVRAWF